MAAGGRAKLALEIRALRFARNRAIETGVATLTPKEGDPEEVAYRAIHVRQPDGKWLIARVGPDLMAAGDEGGALEPLAWMIGTWSDADGTARSVCSWTDNRHFLLRSFIVKGPDETELKVSEVIGWDPADDAIRSWVFDSDGGFGQSVWSRKGADWIVSAKGILPDGGRASAVHIIHPVDGNTYTWSSINRDVDGSILPDIDDIQMVRTASQPAADAGNETSAGAHAQSRADNSPRRSGLSREEGRQP
jgi:hypothetical protein